jgi:hypothetical protein
MWIAEAEGVGREEFATEDEALAYAKTIVTPRGQALVWELDDERGEK